MAHELTFEEIQNCKKTFDKYKNNEDVGMEDARMNSDDLQKAFEELEFEFKENELKEIEKQLSIGSQIDFPNFLRIAAIKYKQKEFVNALEDSFKTFDKNNKDYLSYEELRSIITDFGPKLSPDVADNLLREIGLQNEKKFKYKEFIQTNIKK